MFVALEVPVVHTILGSARRSPTGRALRLASGLALALALVAWSAPASAAPAACSPKNCSQVGADCGTPDNGCGTPLNCGSCNQGKTCDVYYQCISGCVPKTCAQLGATCGSVDNGCGTAISCGTCSAANTTCSTASHTCVSSCTPTTCGQLGAQCGAPSNGCGGTLNCGSCVAGTSCSTGFQCVAACTPATCTSLGAACGTAIADGCGGTISCGTCAVAGESCNAAHQCVTGCNPTTCATLNAACGTPSDGCGGLLDCGSCNGQRVCDSSYQCVTGGGANCTPATCDSIGANCGVPSNGCGGSLSCGSCAAGLSCSYGNVCVAAATTGSVGSAFPAGSLIIPMDQCYQLTDGPTPYGYNSLNQCVAVPPPVCYAGAGYPPGDLRRAFGMLYLLASNQIPIHIILRNDKLSLADADFAISPSGSSPPASYLVYSGGTYTVDVSKLTVSGAQKILYRGMPFVIEASFAQQALAVIGAFNAANGGVFSQVNMHVANYPFNAPIFSTLSTRPKPVGVGPNFGLTTYFDESGITSVVPAGASYVDVFPTGGGWSYKWPSAYFGPNEGCPGDLCTSLAPIISGAPYRLVDTLWTGDSDIQHWKDLANFFQAGGRALVVNTAVSDWEDPIKGEKFIGGKAGLTGASRGAAGSDFCGAMSTKNGSAWPGPSLNFPSSDPYLQIGDLEYVPAGGGLNSNWQFNGIPALNTDGLTSFDVDNKGNKQNFFAVIHGRAVVAGVQTTGHVIYEGGGNAWHGGSTNKDAGLHVMYNTLINSTDDMFPGGPGGGGGLNGWAGTEMTRSSPVGRLTGQSYLGTFDWNAPRNPTLPGNVLWTPSSTSYPYLTGHFREYKPAMLGESGLASGCNPGDSTSPCNWDGAYGIPRWSQRRVFVGSGSAGSYTLLAASSLSANATISYIASRLDQTLNGNVVGILGGIDYGTGAVVEGKPNGKVTVAGAPGRPTIAYVGARDGMLHAFCVVPEAGLSSCYGSYPIGTEIWAFIPKGVALQMNAARLANDWSQVNVGGSIRVADVQDTFGGSTTPVYRTVLIGGTRESGHVFALDISNPNPSNLNNDGLKLLWESDGTNVAGGVTPYVMGPTQGTSIALPGTATPYAVTTSAAGGTQRGINTYVLRIRDGLILASNQKLYTRRIPIAGGSSADLPNSVPALPTVIDQNGSGFDNALLIADVEGYVRKLPIAASGALGSAVTLFDTAPGNCNSGQTCQPIGVSPSIARRGSTLGAFIGTGGVDWARGMNTPSRVVGFDPGVAGISTPFFNQKLSTVFNPVAAGSSATAAEMPVRIYSQLSISGTDIYALGTTLAVDTYNQLLLPSLRPGTYGQVYRWGGINDVVDTSATLLITQGQNFAGGVASALATNSTSTDGVLTMQGTNSVLRVTLASTSLSNAAQNTSLAPSPRPYTVTGWFDLAE